MPGTHHINSPSVLDRRAACPGSAWATMRLAQDFDLDNYEDNESAREGTILHAVCAGTRTRADLTTEQCELVDGALAYRDMVMEGCKTVELERRVAMTDDDFEVVTEGTADVVGIRGDIAVLLDYKFGRVWVKPDSLQMKAYAAAVMQTYGLATCEAHIYQPRAGQGKPTLFTDFHAILEEVQAVVRRSKNPCAPLIPGDHCRYCPAKADCTAAANLETSLVSSGASILTNPVKLGQAAEVAQAVKKRCDTILAACKDATIAGQPTGWKIVERAGKRTITDAKIALDRLLPVIDHDTYVGLLSVPFGKLKDVIASTLKEREGKSVKESEERIAALLGDVLVEGNPSQVMVLDKKKD